MFYREEKTLVDFLFNYWLGMMDNACEQRFRDFGILLYESHEAGELTVAEIENWSQKVQFCPEGIQNHIGTRAWCAYCGDIAADLCGGCNQWFTRWEDLEDYTSILSTVTRHENGYCRDCMRTTTARAQRYSASSTTANVFMQVKA